jgi:hypothetical protein
LDNSTTVRQWIEAVLAGGAASVIQGDYDRAQGRH